MWLAEQGDKKGTRSTRPLCDVVGPETDLDSRTGLYKPRAVSPIRPFTCYGRCAHRPRRALVTARPKGYSQDYIYI